MTTPDQSRIVEDRARPRIMALWWALRPLVSVVRFMQSGAHPDDEMSGMLAALTFRDGINLSYACSTRGEGGQNDIGTEAGADLGALRTREMERACDVLGMRMYWHSETPDDPITDFGFSKSGVETLGKWGRERTLARFVEIVRSERPDILCPTFLDVPGQHGHHRAMTQAAHEVMAAAADPRFPCNLPPWQVRKLYLPATSGAGQAYDDAEPPPPATLTIDGSGGDPVSGWSWSRIGQQSRAFHRTQGMGRWVPPGSRADWKLHLAETHVRGPDVALTAGLPATLGDLAALDAAGPIADHLIAAQAGIDAAIAAFPDYSKVAEGALAALKAVRAAVAGCPADARDEIAHRLEAKECQLSHVLRIAVGVEVHARVAQSFLHAGSSAPLTVELDPGRAEVSVSLVLPEGLREADGVLTVAEDAVPSDPYPAFYDPAAPGAPAVQLTIRTLDTEIVTRVPFEQVPVILPSHAVAVSPDKALINLAGAERTAEVTIRDVRPGGAEAQLDAPEGWTVTSEGELRRITLPQDATAGLYHIPVQVGGCAAAVVRQIDHAHVQKTATHRAADISLRALHAAVPEVRVGYVGAGNDRVDHWLRAIGATVETVGPDDLSSDAVLARFDTIIIGIFAMRFRPGLAAVMPRLHRWTEDGGTLVTLYHRPWDNWDPDTIPPRRLEIGQPSLRWRVTDETAAVRHLGEHDILSVPNRIGPEDWQGWVKERGLYFARSWDPAYTPLLEMSDPEESPHRGALLVADIGKGRHVHTSLILHHQMEHLVPGAFRLMANLIAPRR
ncbi:PIG-L family deacetylase [Primorskyibacter sp. 2E107]|uniref:PIG-L family deacetylase n=1 Tax=Primorskyibacter sp. 2E107 TaxID=3403458 RepID=UPI003AF86F96